MKKIIIKNIKKIDLSLFKVKKILILNNKITRKKTTKNPS